MVADDRYRSKKSITCLTDFYKLIRKVWLLCGHDDVFVQGYPTEEWAQYPCITVKLFNRTLSEHSHKEFRPRERETIRDPDNHEEFIKILGQKFDYYVQFDVWALSNSDADELLDKFESFMATYSSLFAEYGVNKLFFYRQLEDDVNTNWKNAIYKRRIQYYVCLEKITLLRAAELNSVLVNIDVNF